MEADKQPLDPLMDTLWKFTYRLPGSIESFIEFFWRGKNAEEMLKIFSIPVRFFQRSSFDS